jgi:hypothetical protein
MPSSANARRTVALVPHSEAAMHLGLAGEVRELVEEDLFFNGEEIPEDQRNGCYVGGSPLLKSEAGWPKGPVSLLELATARLGRVCANGADFEAAQLPIMGGCEVCGATVAAYNAGPSTSGYIRCLNGCIGDDGFATTDEAEVAIFGEEARA